MKECIKTSGMSYKSEDIANLLVSAFEGGSNYWYIIEDHNRKDLGLDFISDVPIHPEGVVKVSSQEEPNRGVMILDRKAILRGLEIFRINHPRHYADWITENDDACTGDVFLQCCLFGEVIYG